MNFQTRNINPISLIIGLAFFILLIGGLFFVAQGVYLILLYLSPVLLAGALIMDYTVLPAYGKWLVNKYKSNVLSGVVWTLVTLFGFPIVSAILCFRAWTQYKIRQLQKESDLPDNEEYVDYEVVEEESPELQKPYQESK